jgi:dihydroorotase
VVDLTRHGLIAAERLHSRSKITPFADRAIQGLPVMTLVRGKVVMREGEIVASPGWGRQVETRMPPAQVRNADRTTRAITDPRSFGG